MPFVGGGIGDVDPGHVVFVNQLVEGQVGLDVGEELFVFFTAAGVDVGGFPIHVLAVFYAAYCFVECRTAVARADADGSAIPFAQGIEDVIDQGGKLPYVFFGASVVDAEFVGRVRPAQFCYRIVFHCFSSFLFAFVSSFKSFSSSS